MEEESVVITPALEPIYLVVRSITSSLQNVKASKEELSVVMRFVTELLLSLDSDYQSGVSTSEGDSNAIGRLADLMNRLAGYVERQAANSFFHSLVSKWDRIVALKKYEEEIGEVMGLFQLGIELHENLLRNRANEARQVDNDILAVRLTEMESNSTFTDMFNVPREEQLGMIVALQKRLSMLLGCNNEEYRFFTHSVQYLKGITGDSNDLENWTITKYEVEFGSTIKSGLSGDVYSGTMGGTDVVVKVMKNGTVTPKISSLRRVAGVRPTEFLEPSSPTNCVNILQRLLQLEHAHVLKFIGANLSTDYPFFVTPFLQNSNVMNYIPDHPRCDLTKILHEASLGLEYLHSQQFVHGNVKATNILIDDDGRAVLCNYGLAKVRRDFNLRLPSSVDLSSSSQNWKAPELFSGAEPKKSSDVYSFGMTIYEVFSQKQPFADIAHNALKDFVLSNGRPTRPSAEQAPRLSDAIWTLAQQCWRRDPGRRPNSSILSKDLGLFRDLGPTQQVPHMHLRSRTSSYIDGAASRHTPTPYLSRARSSGSQSLNNPRNINAGFVPSLETNIETDIPTIPRPASIVYVPPTTSSPYTRCLTLRLKAPPTDLALYPKGNKAITTQAGGTIIIWDVIRGLELHTYESHQAIRTVLPPMPGQLVKKFVTGSSNGDITLWRGSLKFRKSTMLCSTNVRVGRPIQQLQWRSNTLGVHSFSTSYNVITDTCDIYDSQLVRTDGVDNFAPNKRRLVAGMSTSPTCSAFLHRGKYLVTGDATGTLSVWETETGQQARRTLEYTLYNSGSQTSLSGGCISIVTSPSDDKVFAVAYSTTEIRLWNSSSWTGWTYETIRSPEINAPTGPCHSLPLAFSSDGNWILYPSFSAPKCIEVYDRMSGITTTSCKLNDWPDGRNVHNMILTPDRMRLLLSFEGYNNVLIFCWGQGASNSTWLSKLFNL